METNRLSKLIRRFIPSLIFGLAVFSCQQADEAGITSPQGTEVGSPVPPGTRVPPEIRPHAAPGAGPDEIVIDFEGFASFASLPDTTYAAQGVRIEGATVLTFPYYNWADYPPYGGRSVITGPLSDNDGGAPVTVTLSFDRPFTRVGFRVTARDAVTLNCTNGIGASVGSQRSRAPNLDEHPPYSVYPPNDLVEVIGTDIRGCTVVGPQNFFTLDYLTLRGATDPCQITTVSSIQSTDTAAECKSGPDSVKILRFAVPARGADSGSFTTAAAERRIRVYARAWPDSFSSRIRYRIVDFPGDSFSTTAPTAFVTDTGRILEFDVPAQDTMRFLNYRDYRTADGRWEQKTLGYRIVAFVPDSIHKVESAPFDVRQDAIDVLREEYVELLAPRRAGRRNKVPARDDINQSETPAFPGNNSGDYLEWMYPHSFSVALDSLEAGFKPPHPGQWQVNVIFRSPVHNLHHVDPADDPNVDSWHMYGCAADLQTFPFPRSDSTRTAAAESYWLKLSTVARQRKFQIESRPQSGAGHVHVERECF